MSMESVAEIRFDLTKAERKREGSSVGYTFRIDKYGFSVIEHWPSMDELYSDGCCIIIPPRIWALALPWIINNSKAMELKP